MTPEFWLNLQRMYDLEMARVSTDVAGIEPLVETPSFASRWRGKFRPAERDDPRYNALAQKHLR